jgi:hypothetical protein
VVNIADVYALSPADPFLHDNSFDVRFGYRTRSVVGIPLATRDGQVIGVLQLINRKRRAGVPLEDPTQATEVTPFRDIDVDILCSLASLAAVSLETSRLYHEIGQLFEGFVHASVTTIEQRDPTMSGHSFRVAEGTIALAKRVERLERGPWAGTRFTAEDMRELRYAALLHDFGKVSVPEKVLTKSRKLYDEQLCQIEDRFRLAVALHRAAQFEAWLHTALDDPEQVRERLPQLMEELAEHAYELDCMLGLIHDANQPNIIMAGDYSSLGTIRRRRFLDLQGLPQPLLTEQEVVNVATTSTKAGSRTKDGITPRSAEMVTLEPTRTAVLAIARARALTMLVLTASRGHSPSSCTHAGLRCTTPARSMVPGSASVTAGVFIGDTSNPSALKDREHCAGRHATPGW